MLPPALPAADRLFAGSLAALKAPWTCQRELKLATHDDDHREPAANGADDEDGTTTELIDDVLHASARKGADGRTQAQTSAPTVLTTP